MILNLLLLTAVVVESVELHSSCNDLDDGLRYILPQKTGNVIPVICNNGYTIIDISLNGDVISTYFSSFDIKYSTNEFMIYGTECGDLSSWRSFWTPADKDTLFRVSPDCLQCETSNSYDENVAYYMTNYYHCGNAMRKNWCPYNLSDPYIIHSIQMSYDVEDISVSQCNICDGDVISSETAVWANCYALRLSADVMTSDNHDNCVIGNKLVVRPSVVSSHAKCTCYKPQKSYIFDHNIALPTVNMYNINNNIEIDPMIIISHNINEKEEKEENDCNNQKYYLSNEDFTSGTYKIQQCGEYIFSEDIEINFNAPPDDIYSAPDWSPNTYDLSDLYWYPRQDQLESDMYPGLESFHGEYQFGFFTAISIQIDNVSINLNGHKLSMHKTYYLQQRFFSLIELGDKPFVINQGPANFGRDRFISVNNIVIKNGILGLVSHQAIHGNNCMYVTIKNIRVKHFDIAGIHFNGAQNVVIHDVVIGPQNINIPVVGRYVHCRALLPRLRYFVNNYGSQIVPFGNNPANNKTNQTIRELADKLVAQMDMIYFHFIDNIIYSDTDIDWLQAKSLFLNPTGWLDGGSSYGLILNGAGTAVLSIGFRQTGTRNIELKNIEIFGIGIQPKEKFWKEIKNHLKENAIFRGIFFDNIDWYSITGNDIDNNVYIGDVYTDILFAANQHLKVEFCFLNTMYVEPLQNWVFLNDKTVFDENQYKIVTSCGSDIQSHNSKGAFGLRIDGVDNIKLNNIYIHDIMNWGDLADQQICDEYDIIQYIDRIYKEIQSGYTGTRTHGISIAFANVNEINNITIETVESLYGSSTGISIYKGSIIQSISNVNISNIFAGTSITQKQLLNLKLQNPIPFVCAIQIDENNDYKDIYPLIINNVDQNTISGKNIRGYDICNTNQTIASIYDQQQQQFYHNRDNMVINIIIKTLVIMSLIVSVYCFYYTKLHSKTIIHETKKLSLNHKAAGKYGTFL